MSCTGATSGLDATLGRHSTWPRNTLTSRLYSVEYTHACRLLYSMSPENSSLAGISLMGLLNTEPSRDRHSPVLR